MQAKKSLGQHFLRSKKALDQIIDAADPLPDDIILEIGPGEGVLTERLIPFAGRVIAIEKDDDLIPILTEKFADFPNFDLLHRDVLDFDTEILREYGVPYKLVANIPYYITGMIFRKFLEASYQPKQMVVLVQKEVADRVMARNGKESLLSLSVKAYGIPYYVGTVPAGAFAPAPSVDSAILNIEEISRNHFDSSVHEAMFFKLIHAGFAHKRKQLGGNLKELVENPETLLESVSLATSVRAEDIPLEKWIELARKGVENKIA